jgi:hypothetical protein
VVTELICDSCGRLYNWYPIGEGEKYICGAHLGGRECCGGTLREQKPAPKLQRLTIEEVVYWLVVVGCVGLAERVAAREVEWVKRSRNVRRNILRSRTHPHWYRREAGFVAFLCGEALRALGADQ